MDITQLLGSELGQQVLSGIASQNGTTQKETSSVISAATPVLLGMLKNNASSEQGANNLLGALNQHDGSIFDNLGAFLNSGDTADGQGILGHILGNKQTEVQNAISKKTGVSVSQVAGILAMLAPIIMGKLGSQSKSSGTGSAGGLTDILGGLMGNSGNSSIGGSILSSVLGQAMGGGQQKKGGLGGLLGGILGGK